MSSGSDYDDMFIQIMLNERGLQGLLKQVYGFAYRFLEESLVEEPESLLLDMVKDVVQGEKTSQDPDSGGSEGQDGDGDGDGGERDFSMLPPEVWHEILFNWADLTVEDVMCVAQTCSRLADIVQGDDYARDKVRSLFSLATNLERKAYRPIRFGLERGFVDPFAAAEGLLSDAGSGRNVPKPLVAALVAAVERWTYGAGHDVVDWLWLLGRVKGIAMWEDDVGRALVRSDWGGADVCIVEEVGVCAGMAGDTVTLLRVWEELGETRVGLGDILFRALCWCGGEEAAVCLAKEWMTYSWIDPDKRSASGESPLWAAVVCGSPSVVRALLDWGRLRMAPRSDSGEDETSLQDAFGWACAKRGYTDIVQWFLATGGVDVNFSAHRLEISPFLRACGCGVLSTVKVLLESGQVDLGYRDSQGLTAHHASAAARTPDTTELLDLLWATAAATDGAPAPSTVVTSDGSTPLHTACLYGNVPGVEWLLGREDVDVEARDECGCTPLATAASDGQADVVLALLASGCVDVMTRTNRGQSVLHLALRAFEPSSLSLPTILDAIHSKWETIIHTKTSELVTPIHIACMHTDPSALRCLFARWTDTDANVQDEDGWTPLHYACSDWGGVDTVRVLLEVSQGVLDLDVRDESGHTPLMVACEREDVAVVSMLLNAGADPTVRDTDGRTALCYGLSSARVVDTLLKTGVAPFPPYPSPLFQKSEAPLERGGRPLSFISPPGDLLSPPVSGESAPDVYGSSFALSQTGGLLVVSGLYNATGGDVGVGRVDVYLAAESSQNLPWVFQFSIPSPEPQKDIHFGRSVALSLTGSILVAGTNRIVSGSGYPFGVLWVYNAVYTPQFDYTQVSALPGPNLTALGYDRYNFGQTGSVVIAPDTRLLL